jgi:hypothetical protein
MERAKVTEIPRELEPVDRDTFIDDLGRIAVEKEVDTDTDSSYNDNVTER